MNKGSDFYDVAMPENRRFWRYCRHDSPGIIGYAIDPGALMAWAAIPAPIHGLLPSHDCLPQKSRGIMLTKVIEPLTESCASHWTDIRYDICDRISSDMSRIPGLFRKWLATWLSRIVGALWMHCGCIVVATPSRSIYSPCTHQ